MSTYGVRLAQPRGKKLPLKPRDTRFKFIFPATPPVPNAVEELTDCRKRQNAVHAWKAASQLLAIIDFWEVFLQASHFRQSITDDSQQSLTTIFPELVNVQSILDHVGYYATKCRPPWQKPEDFSCDLTPFYSIASIVDGLISTSAKDLVSSGIHLSSFETPIEPGWDHLQRALDGDAYFSQSPLCKGMSPFIPPELRQLQQDVQALVDVLKKIPTIAFKSWTSMPTATLPLSADVKARTVTLNDKEYQVQSEAHAALVQAFIELGAIGEANRRSSKKLIASQPELKGLDRIDRHRDQLPKPIAALIGTSDKLGYYLDFEKLE